MAFLVWTAVSELRHNAATFYRNTEVVQAYSSKPGLHGSEPRTYTRENVKPQDSQLFADDRAHYADWFSAECGKDS
jgi:hypothetical protein